MRTTDPVMLMSSCTVRFNKGTSAHQKVSYQSDVTSY